MSKNSKNILQGESPVKALGFPAGTKVLMITCDEFGELHASNMGVIEAMEDGLGIRKYAVGATMQMPSPWVPEAIAYARSHPEADIGVHLVIENCYLNMKWKPICSKAEVPGLYSPEGYFWDSAKEAWAHSNEKEIYKECRAQIEMALRLGMDVTHLDGHMDFQWANRAGYCRVVGELAQEFRLPFRQQSRRRYEESRAEKLRDEVLSRGIISPDEDTEGILKKPNESWKEFYLRRLREFSPGLIDIYIHPALDSEEIRGLQHKNPKKAESRVEQYQLLVHDPDFREAMKRPDIRIVGWRDIRNLQRNL